MYSSYDYVVRPRCKTGDKLVSRCTIHQNGRSHEPGEVFSVNYIGDYTFAVTALKDGNAFTINNDLYSQAFRKV